MSLENLFWGILARSDTNPDVLSQKMDRDLKFWKSKYYMQRNIGGDQLNG